MIRRKKILVVEDEFIIADVLTNIFKTADYKVCGVADNVKEALEMIADSRPDFVLVDIFLKGRATGIDLAHRLMEMDIPFIYISANANEKVLKAAKVTRPYGFVVKPFREKDVLIALDIAIYRHESQQENGARQNATLQKKITEILASSKKWDSKVLELGKSLQPFMPFEFLSVGMQQQEDEDFYELSFFRIGYDEYQVLDAPELMVVTKQKKHELARLKTADKHQQLPAYYNEQDMTELLDKSSFKKVLADIYGLKSHLSLPVHLADGRICYFSFYSRRPVAYQDEHLVLSNRVQPLLAHFMAAMINAPNSPMAQNEDNYIVKHPISKSEQPNPFTGIIGGSHLLLTVFDHVMQVSGADSSVLILGESGTGKEKIAERIHALSRRKEKSFVKINCAALPATLIDSELFGHEKGAFTGAYEKKIGKFEQAHGGTLFLDEIGELPLESQSKLLRVLQEREIERVGGRTTIKIDVRIIAATNRNLEKEVAEGRFRLDLFYRINVFPIVMPPLRERTEDIPDLAKHFLNIYARKIGKVVRGITPQVLDSMKNYHWPGNIRELENLIERNVLLTRDDMIKSMALPTQLEQNSNGVTAEPKVITMSEGERAHIIAALRKCNGKIWGEGGAASLLNLPPTTLNSKMKKLGIRKDFGI